VNSPYRWETGRATNTPRGAKTAATYEGMFKELKVNRGFQMPRADEGQ
jgi:hypothetical protein